MAFPTETVYGLGADALDDQALERLFAAKGRPFDDPVIVHVGGVDDLAGVAEAVPDVAESLARAFWPGPLTLVVPRGRRVSLAVTAGLDSVGVRAPSHPVARALIAAFAGPVAAPSANQFGRPSPTEAAHVIADLDDRVHLVLDGGASPIGVESTVVDCLSSPPRVLRPGAVPAELLAPWGVTSQAEGGGARGPALAPGQQTRHYAPRAPLILVRSEAGDAELVDAIWRAARRLAEAGRAVTLLLAQEDVTRLGALPKGVEVRSLGALDQPASVARCLFAELRRADLSGSEAILARDFGGAGLAAAVRDRLVRASSGRTVWVAPGSESTAAESIAALALEDRDGE